MTPEIKLTRDSTSAMLIKFGRVMRRPLQDVVTEFARRTTREVIAITPPASAGITGRDAYQQGRAAISRDMQRALAPVRLKGKRREQHPDAYVAYRARRVWRDAGVGARVGRVAKAFVDQRKFNALFKELSGRVGRMAAGWGAAALALKVARPAWISRHGVANGRVVQDFSGDHLRITVTNFSPTVRGNVRFEMARRIPYAQRYATNGMTRNIDAVVRKSGGEAGFRNVRPGLGGSI